MPAPQRAGASGRGAPIGCITAERARYADAGAGRESPAGLGRVHLGGAVMGRSLHAASSIRAFAQHAEFAYSVAEGATPAADIEPLSTSWRRSATSVDPADGGAPRILTAGELKELREPLGKLIFSA